MNKKNIGWGLMFILAAAFIILGAFGILGNPLKLVVTVLLIPVILTGIRHLNFGEILFPLAIICILYDDFLGIQALTPWPVLFTALFLSIGLSLLFPKRKYSQHTQDEKNDFDEPANETNDSIINIETRFNAIVKYINSSHLQTVNADCSFSGLKLYFDHADFPGEQAVMNVHLNFSGLELYVPKSWYVVDNVSCTLSGIEKKGVVSENAAKKLFINGSASFSGITIHHI